MSEESSFEVDISAWDPNVLPAKGASTELVLLATESMRARRRPLAIAALWGWQTTLATFIALPAAAAVASWYGKHPSGDAPLWQKGGLPLIDLFLDGRGVIRETIALSAIVLLVAGFADLIPLGALLTSLAYVTRARRAPPMRDALARAAAAFPTFATLFAMTSLAEILLVGLAFATSSAIAGAATGKLGEARADQLAWLASLVILGIAGIVGVVHDLARAGAIRFRVKALRSYHLAVNALARSPASVLWSWAWRALAGWAPVAMGAVVATRLGGRGGGPLVTLFFVHQLVLLVRVAFRASWLAAGLRAVDVAHRVVGVPGTRRSGR